MKKFICNIKTKLTPKTLILIGLLITTGTLTPEALQLLSVVA